MNATEWLETEATGQQFMTADRLSRFRTDHADRWHAAVNGVPEIVILDRPYALRPISRTDRSWAEPVRFRHLTAWPPAFGAEYSTAECDPNIYTVQVQGGRVEQPPPRVVLSAVYLQREVSASFPCEPLVLAHCAAATLASLRGRRVSEIGDVELSGESGSTEPRPSRAP